MHAVYSGGMVRRERSSFARKALLGYRVYKPPEKTRIFLRAPPLLLVSAATSNLKLRLHCCDLLTIPPALPGTPQHNHRLRISTTRPFACVACVPELHVKV